MKTFLTLFASAALTLSASAYADTPPTSISEGFDDVTTLSGWSLNGSSATSWYQGISDIFTAQSGPATSYIASNYLTAGQGDAFSNLLITPEFTLSGPTRLTFYTRNEGDYVDTLNVLFSAGSGTDASGFTTSLLTIGGATAYPDGWTKYTADITGSGTGRIGFQYTGTVLDSSYIGIDTVAISAVPEPSTWLMLGLGLAGVGLVGRRSRRAAAGAGLALAALGMSQGALAADDKGMVVVRDAESGQLRAPTAAEYRALVPQAQAAEEAKYARGVKSDPQVTVNKYGARRLNVEHKALYSVITRNADGTQTEACVTDESIADHASHAALTNPRTAQAKETNYEAQ